MRAALILAGGRSTRFGDADKAVAPLAGTPMIRRVADRVSPAVDGIVVNCRRAQASAIREALDGCSLPVSFGYDETPDLGPVGGMMHGLRTVSRECDAEFAFVVACDMPFVDRAIVEYLFDRSNDVDAVIPRLEDGWFQTTHAVFHAQRMAAACARAIETDRRRVMAPLEELEVRTVTQADLESIGTLDSFENVNTRAELEAAADRLRSSDADRGLVDP